MTVRDRQAEKDLVEAKVGGLLAALGWDLSLEPDVTDDAQIYFNITGKDHHYFLANKGEVVKSLGLVVQACLEKQFEGTNVKVKPDANSHFREREGELLQIAQEAAEKLSKPGDEIVLEPMNPYDRRLIHLALQDNPNLKTESRGEGHFKKVLIRYIGE